MNTFDIYTEEGRFFYLTTPKSHILYEQNSVLQINQTIILDTLNNDNCTNAFCRTTLEFSFKNVLLALFLISLGLLTVLGNILVLLAIFVDFHLRSPTHYMMGSLALADLLLGTLVLPFSSTELYFDTWPFGERFCEIWLTTDVLCCTASIYLVLVISIDRYIGITRPLRYNMIMTKKRLSFIIIFVWSLSLVVSLAPQIGWKSPQKSNYKCEVNENMAYALFSASFSFYIPLLIILIVYYRIYKEARAQSKFLKTGVKTSKTTDGSGAIITLRVHIGPTNSRKMPQTCTCTHKLNNGSISSSSFRKSEIGKKISSYSSGKTRSIDEESPFEPDLKLNEEILNSHTKPILNSKKSTTLCKMCSLPINTNGVYSSLTKNALTGSSGLLSSKIVKFKNEQKAAKTLAIVCGCFTICWLPFFILLPLESFKLCSIPKSVFRIFFWLGYCNSAMNPLIYGLSSREFRRAYKGILNCNLKYRNRKEREKVLKFKFKSNLNNLKN